MTAVARLADALAPPVAAAFVRFLGATLRVGVTGADALRPHWAARRPLIYAIWHGRILMVPWLNARLRRTHGARPVTVLVSRSRDGEIVARFIRCFGLDAVRGSSSRGGGPAARELVGLIERGEDVAVVPDGPRGPRGRVQPGVVTLAALTGAPIVPLAVAARPAKRLGSWDEFMLPLPFARCALVFGPPVEIPRDADRERASKDVERSLEAASAAAERLVAG